MRWCNRLGAGAFVLGILAAGSGGAAVTDAFVADFSLSRGAIGLGSATFSLRPTGSDCYVYRGHARPNLIARVFIGAIRDESRFCIDGNHIRPRYFSHRVGDNASKSYTLTFDWPAHAAVYRSGAGRQVRLSLGDAALDPLSIQIAARRWVAAAPDPNRLGTADFKLADGDELKTYTLRARPGGTIDTPAGRFDTLIVERAQTRKHLRFWLAAGANWIPVRVEEQKGDGAIFRLSLTRLRRDPG